MTSPSRPGVDRGPAYSPDAAARPDGGGPDGKPSLLDDFLEIFYAPARVFARREKSNFGLAFLIVSVLAGIFAFASRSLLAAVMDAEWPRTAARMAENPRITEEMIAQQRGIMQGMGAIMSYVGTPVMILIVALLAWLFARIVSARISYQQAALIVTLAWIPRLVQGLFNTIQALVFDPASIQGMHSITYSPARFLDGDAPRMLLGALSRFDLFTLWVTVLIAIGISVMARVPRSQAAIAALLVWLAGSIPFLMS